MEYPYIKLVMPPSLAKVPNGKMDAALLAKVKCGGQMWTTAAKSFNALYDAALAAGIELKNIGDYRPLEPALKLFLDRYSKEDKGRKPQVTRTYEGVTWYLKPGMAPCSTPGKSNHGWGLAIDLGVEIKGKIESLSAHPKMLKWMCTNGPKYGFYLQGSDPKSAEFEAWHWQYAIADKVPPALKPA
jgi:LAS superfamily LD-carboxypeptidase LdcB